MRVKVHKLFELFLQAHKARPKASIVHSLSQPPRLGEFLSELDPEMNLDWSGESFQGMPSLRQKVIDRWGYGPVSDADDVLITAGTAEANFLAVSTLVQPGDELIVDVPGWPQPLVLGDAIGATVKKLMRDESSGWALDLDQLSAMITPKTRLIFLCNPNNPTGQLLDEKTLLAVANLADRVGAYVLTDEVYRGMEWSEEETPRMASLYDRGISTGSVSKVLGMQGLRTGWLITRDKQLLFDAMVLREDTSEIMNVMGEAIADIALCRERFAALVAHARKTGQSNMDRLHRFVSEHAELDWYRPRAGLIGFCQLNTTIDASELAQQLLSPPYHTFVMPGEAYGFPNHLRVGAGGEPELMTEGLAQFERYLKQLSG